MSNNKFDKDLKFGQLFENVAEDLLKGNKKIEVKSDAKWLENGNIAFETWCNGKPSGINVTEADFWFYFLTKDDKVVGAYLFATELLKRNLRKLKEKGEVRIVEGGDRIAAKMILVPIKDIWKLYEL
jgi:hypothetical protein